MSEEKEKWNTWKSLVNSSDMADVLNTMIEIKDSGDITAKTLLQNAGCNIELQFKKMKNIRIANSILDFEEFRSYCIAELLGVKKEIKNRKIKVFISYNHHDATTATRLALELQQSPEIDVFIDHWNMSVGDSLLDRIESGIDDSSFLLVILSSHSVESKWVRTELGYAYLKEQSMNRNFILPVIIDECKLPIHVAGRVFVDYRSNIDKERGLQYILNTIRGGKPFSQIVSDFLKDSTYRSPYTDKAMREGRRILIDLAQYREMDVEENQKWLLWELFQSLLGKYKGTLKIGKNIYSNYPANSIVFILIDRWNVKSCEVILTEEEFSKGLWEGDFDLIKGSSLTSADLRFLGNQGRLTFQAKYNSHTDKNPFLNSCSPKMKPIYQSLKKTLKQFDEGSQQSFLFDLQSIIFLAYGRKVKIVIGSGTEDLCLAFSPMHNMKHSLASNQWAIFEIFDPFFYSCKHTAVCPEHLTILFEGDINLMSSDGEILLGPA